jgi:hypothetical protein
LCLVLSLDSLDNETKRADLTACLVFS